MSEPTPIGSDKLVKICAVIGACGILLTALSLFLNWQTAGITNTSDIRALTTSVNSLATNFQTFANQADARLRVVETTLAGEQITISNQQASMNQFQMHLDQIEQASRASLSPVRK